MDSGFKDRLTKALKRKSLNQTDLANRLGVGQPTIARLANGGRPGWKTVPKIAEMLEVPIEWLMVGDNPPPWISQEEPAAGAQVIDEKINRETDPIIDLVRHQQATIASLIGVVRSQGRRIKDLENQITSHDLAVPEAPDLSDSPSQRAISSIEAISENMEHQTRKILEEGAKRIKLRRRS